LIDPNISSPPPFQVLQHMEDVKVREMQIFDFKKKIAESETKLKQQQNLYEAVRSDRNLYSKNLIESQVGGVRLITSGPLDGFCSFGK